LENLKHYNPKIVKKYLSMIDSVNEKAEKRIENIRKKRDEQTNFFDRCIIEERKKPIGGASNEK
tara:strand:- start:739 stop:930 length:192 start_codon:yes stop_codon:yes gene_type:complete